MQSSISPIRERGIKWGVGGWIKHGESITQCIGGKWSPTDPKWLMADGEYISANDEGKRWNWCSAPGSTTRNTGITSNTDSVLCYGVECIAL